MSQLQYITVTYEQQSARMSRHATASDGQADWLDVQTLYASGRFADQPPSTPPVVRECYFILKL